VGECSITCITFFASYFSYSVSDKKWLCSQAICKGQPCSELANLAWTQFPNIMTGCSMRGCKFVCELARTLLSLPSACASAADRKATLSEITHTANKERSSGIFPHRSPKPRENRIKWIMMGVVFNHLWPDVGAKKATIAENLLWPSPAFFQRARCAQCVCCGSLLAPRRRRWQEARATLKLCG
jgi:hypothetical protein